MRMYILIRDDLPNGIAMTSAAHASLACYLKYSDDNEMHHWLENSFKKVICSVNQEEFDRAKQVERYVLLTESSLGGRECSLAFSPRGDWPKAFRFYKLWR